MKKILLIVLILILVLGASAGYVCANYNVDNILSGFTEVKTNTFQWETNGDTAVITGIGALRDAAVTIPSQIYLSLRDGTYIEDPLQGDLYQVRVGSTAFAQCATIQSVTFADGVTIENNRMSSDQIGMFSGCENLIFVHNIPDSVTDMAYTFYGCTSLKEVDRIPDSVTDLDQCFYGCAELEISPAIPQSVTNIRECFLGCVSLHSIGEILSTATDFIGVFSGCQSLVTTPDLPDTVRSMERCFYGCISLREVTKLPTKLTDMTETFAGCTSLVELNVKIPAKVMNMTRTFEGCSALVRLAHPLPDNVQIMLRTFSDCSSFTTLPDGIPKSAANLDYTFTNCSSLTRIDGTFPKNISSMLRTFSNCTSLEAVPLFSIDLLNLHLNQQTDCFYNCPALKEVSVDYCTNLYINHCSFLSKVNLLHEHVTEGICKYCKYVTGTYTVDGLDVYFLDVPYQVYESCIDALKKVVPQKLKDANHLLSVIATEHYTEYVQKLCQRLGFIYDPLWSTTGGLNLTRNGISYASLQVLNNVDGYEIEWDDQEFRTMIHELTHGFDFSGAQKYSQTHEWVQIHEAEQYMIYEKYYGKEMYFALSEYDRLEETFSMASEGYFGNPQWLQKHCPQMYTYMDALWGTNNN